MGNKNKYTESKERREVPISWGYGNMEMKVTKNNKDLTLHNEEVCVARKNHEK